MRLGDRQLANGPAPDARDHAPRGRTTVDVLVVGAGQARLAAARALSALHLSVIVHERHARVGDSWRRRFDSLVLFTPRAISQLPDLAHTGDSWGYPGKDEMGDYLERYAYRFHVPVVTGDGIARFSRSPDSFLAQSKNGTVITCRAVVIATGRFQRPRVPRCVASLADEIPVLDALTFRFFGPPRILGADTTTLALRAGLLTVDKTTRVARLMRSLDPTPGLHLRPSALRRAGVVVAPRCVGADGDHLVFADGTRRRCDAVVCATGYRDDTAWIDIEGATSSERFLEDYGVSPVRGSTTSAANGRPRARQG